MEFGGGDHHVFAKMPGRPPQIGWRGTLAVFGNCHVIVNWRPWCSTSEAPAAILNRWNVPPTRRRAPLDSAHKLL